MRKILASVLALAMAASMAACGSTPAPSTSAPAGSTAPEGSSAAPAPEAPKAGGEIYYLNFKPEIAEIYAEIAKAYEAETGVKLNVVTAAAGTYEQTLMSEIAKADSPTLFQINGPKGYANWKDYCKDLSGTELYQHMPDKSLAVTGPDGGVYGIPYVVEGYGIIYNDAIMTKYFATEGAKAKSMDEINNFAKLKEVVEDMTAKKDALGIKGVFASTALKPGEDWRWQTHLANVPMHYEFEANKTDLTGDIPEIKFQYGKEYQNIFDLYLNNSTTDKKLLGTKSGDDSMSEFALGQCAMVQNGNWGWSQINGVDGNTVKAEDVKFMPIYTGVAGEEKQGLCIGTENFFAINSQATPEKQKLAEDFIYWLYSSATGKDFVTNKLGFIAPFDTFTDAEKPTDPLAKEVLRYTGDTSKSNIPWDFVVFPSQEFKNNFGAALLQYAQGTKSWDDVEKVVIDQWKAESN